MIKDSGGRVVAMRPDNDNGQQHLTPMRITSSLEVASDKKPSRRHTLTVIAVVVLGGLVCYYYVAAMRHAATTGIGAVATSQPNFVGDEGFRARQLMSSSACRLSRPLVEGRRAFGHAARRAARVVGRPRPDSLHQRVAVVRLQRARHHERVRPRRRRRVRDRVGRRWDAGGGPS